MRNSVTVSNAHYLDNPNQFWYAVINI